MPEGFRLGRYQLSSKLAVGGMAEIWLAAQSGPAGFSKQLVIKKILPHLAADRAFVEMFLNEGRFAALINHPNVVQVFELGESGGDYYLVMEHVPGWSLRAIIARLRDRGQSAPADVVAQLFVGICRGLHAAHELADANGRTLGLVHRDMSPENVLVAKSGEAKVSDFGIAKATSAVSSTRPGETKGKIAYMAPEQLLGKTLDRRADLYSVGATLYEALCGTRPLVVPADAALSMSLLEEKPLPLRSRRPDVPAELEAVCAKALEKDPGRRFADAIEMARQLEPFAASTSTVADWLAMLFPEGVTTPVAASAAIPATAPIAPVGGATEIDMSPGPPPKRRAWVAVVPLVLALSAGAAWWWWPAPPEPVVVVEPPKPAPPPTPIVEAPPAPIPAPAPAPVPAPTPPRAGRGKLLVRVNPWADVLIDGKMVGATPLQPVELSAGKHSVTVTNSELGRSRTVSVNVRANRQEKVEINLKD